MHGKLQAEPPREHPPETSCIKPSTTCGNDFGKVTVRCRLLRVENLFTKQCLQVQ